MAAKGQAGGKGGSWGFASAQRPQTLWWEPAAAEELPTHHKHMTSTPVVFLPPAAMVLLGPCKAPATPLRELGPWPGGSEGGKGSSVLSGSKTIHTLKPFPWHWMNNQLTEKECGDREGAIMAKLLSSSGLPAPGEGAQLGRAQRAFPKLLAMGSAGLPRAGQCFQQPVSQQGTHPKSRTF